MELSHARTYNFSGPNPISFEAITAWQTMNGVELSPWEVKVIKKLDSAYFKVQNGKK